MVSAYQVNIEPLERMQRLFGGRIYVRDRHGRQTQPCHVWYLTGPKARSAMDTIRPLMSAKRRGQIDVALRKTRLTDEELAVRKAKRVAAGRKGYAAMRLAIVKREEAG